jgi:hypothetical protein
VRTEAARSGVSPIVAAHRTRSCLWFMEPPRLLAPRWPDFAAGLEVLAHDITTERMVELPNDS